MNGIKIFNAYSSKVLPAAGWRKFTTTAPSRIVTSTLGHDDTDSVHFSKQLKRSALFPSRNLPRLDREGGHA